MTYYQALGTHELELFRIWDSETKTYLHGVIEHSRRNARAELIDWLSNNFNNGAVITTDNPKLYRKLCRRYRVAQVKIRPFLMSGNELVIEVVK